MDIINLSRRGFLQSGAAVGGGLLLGISAGDVQAQQAAGGVTPFSAVLSIAPDGWVTIAVGHAEMGQGVATTVPMVVAEELCADWSRVRWKQAPNDIVNFGRPNGGIQITAGSGTQRLQMEQFRRTGAAGREMLIAAAAVRWQVKPETLRAEKGQVIAADGRRATFGELAMQAAGQPVPADPKLKPREQWTLIGTSPARLDIPDKTTGRAVYGMDVKLPGLLTAVVERPPVSGSSVESFDASEALKVKGVRSVHAMPFGVAVVADHYWAAKKGREALKVVWKATANDSIDTATLKAQCERAAESGPSLVADQRGSFDQAYGAAVTRIEATYSAQLLAHSCMEPMNQTAWVHDGIVEVWGGIQAPTVAEAEAAAAAGVTKDKVRVHTTFLGGGLGRRSEGSDTTEAVQVAMAAKAPVKVVWSREDDMRHDYYRSLNVAKFRAGLDASGNLVAFKARLAGQSVLARAAPARVRAAKGIDYHSVVNIADMAYDKAPHVLVEQCRVDNHLPPGFWRSVGSSGNIFLIEGFMDEVAHAAKEDPVRFRLKHIGTHERDRRVLEAVAEKSGWFRPLAPATTPGSRRGRGVAISEVFSGWVAQVIEVTVGQDNTVKIDRVVAACDFGTIVHPRIVESQVVSAVITGLDGAMFNDIRIEKGAVVNSNFHDNPVPRITDAPTRIEVHVLPVGGPPGGVGEAATPGVAPALANAIFNATGKRLRQLPLRLEAAASV